MKKDPEKKIHKVQWRGGFSDRNGINKIPTTIQLKDFDNRTRIALGNFFLRLFNGEIYINPFGTFFNDETCEKFLKCLISEVYCEPLIDFCYRSQYKEDYYKEYIKPTIMEQNYADILTLLEFLVEFSSRYDPNFNVPPVYLTTIKQEISEEINYIFESEFVGYRVVDDIITPISDGVEIQTIQDGLDVEFGGCRSHIHKALAFLSDRENPDYKNSIKESISAVEAICQIITRNYKSTLGQALKSLEDKGIKLHEALKKSFSSLYGYTSDEGGIRHAEGLFESNVTFEEAKYMLVCCCAFVNYLIAEYGKSNEKQRN